MEQGCQRLDGSAKEALPRQAGFGPGTVIDGRWEAIAPAGRQPAVFPLRAGFLRVTVVHKVSAFCGGSASAAQEVAHVVRERGAAVGNAAQAAGRRGGGHR